MKAISNKCIMNLRVRLLHILVLIAYFTHLYQLSMQLIAYKHSIDSSLKILQLLRKNYPSVPPLNNNQNTLNFTRSVFW